MISTKVNERQEQVDRLYATLFGQPKVVERSGPSRSLDRKMPQLEPREKPKLSDKEVVRRATAGKYGAKYQRLMDGDFREYDDDKSRATRSVLRRLSRYTEDADQIDRIIRETKLMRTKWDDPRGTSTWGRQEIEKVLEDRTAIDRQAGQDADDGAFHIELCTPARLAKVVADPTWLVDRLLVKDQPAVIGGPKKALKTSTVIDLGVSLATATPFLGRFAVHHPVRVALLSGESGEWAIWNTIERVCAARRPEKGSYAHRHCRNVKGKRIDPAAIKNLLVSFTLPQVGREEHLEVLRVVLKRHRIEVMILDPLYLSLLAGTGVQASNFYETGPLLAKVSRACLDAGATPLFCHHLRKGAGEGKRCGLDDLTFSGVAEFARQWLLLSRIEPFDAETGTHRLWLAAGGSSGQAGMWAMEVHEGRLNADFTGRHWKVEVTPAKEYRERQSRAANDDRRHKGAEQDSADDSSILARLDELDPDRAGAGYNRLQTLAKLSDARMMRAVHRLAQAGKVKEVEVRVETGSNAMRGVKGLVRVDE